MKEDNTRTLTIELGPEKAEYLASEAERRNLSLTTLIELALHEYISDPVQNSEKLKSFLNFAHTRPENFQHFTAKELLYRMALDWLAGLSVESETFGATLSRSAIFAGSPDLDNYFTECKDRMTDLLATIKENGDIE